MAKRTKEEKDQEFIAAVEQLLGFPVMDWQKPHLIYIREQTVTGKEIDLRIIVRPRSY